jgi:hypothetical protein
LQLELAEIERLRHVQRVERGHRLAKRRRAGGGCIARRSRQDQTDGGDDRRTDKKVPE